METQEATGIAAPPARLALANESRRSPNLLLGASPRVSVALLLQREIVVGHEHGVAHGRRRAISNQLEDGFHAAAGWGIKLTQVEHLHEACVLAIDTLAARSHDIAFALVYLDDTVQGATPHAVERLAETRPDLIHTLTIPSTSGRAARLVVGVNARLPFDDQYRSFLDLVADQLIVEALIDRSLQLDPGFDNGAIHNFLITYESARQGAKGDFTARSREHFNVAVELTGGQLASPYVSMAEAVSVSKQDRTEFESLLKRALAIDTNVRPEWRLNNKVMQRRARWLLSQEDDLFLAERGEEHNAPNN